MFLTSLGPTLFLFLGDSLLAVTPTFGEVHVNATKRTYFSKTAELFSSAISALMSAVS